MVQRIIFLDIDGTLVPGQSSGQYLADRLGHSEAVRQAEQSYAVGQMSNADVSVIDAEGWAGASCESIDRMLDGLPLIDGIAEVVQWCLANDVTPALASLAWRPVSDALARRLGIIATGGPTIHAADGVYLGTVLEHFDEFDKRDRALELCASLGIDPRECIAIGDSRSDEPLFEAVGFTIALNASGALRTVASVALDTSDLRDALRFLREIVHRDPGFSAK